jgi:hypothetical protein
MLSFTQKSKKLSNLQIIQYCVVVATVILLLFFICWFFFLYIDDPAVWDIKELTFYDDSSLYLKLKTTGGNYGTAHSQLIISAHKQLKPYRDDYVFDKATSYFYKVHDNALDFYTVVEPIRKSLKFKSDIPVRIHLLSPDELSDLKILKFGRKLNEIPLRFYHNLPR